MQLAAHYFDQPYYGTYWREYSGAVIDLDDGNKVVAKFRSLGSALLGKVILEQMSKAIRHVSAAELDAALRTMSEREFGTTDYPDLVQSKTTRLMELTVLELQRVKAERKGAGQSYGDFSRRLRGGRI